MHIEVEWDSAKATSNLRKHGVGFEEACSVLRKLHSMRKQYEFSTAKRAKEVPHLARLQRQAKGKTRITIMLDNDLLVAFRAQASARGTGYQTLINLALRQATVGAPLDERTLRRVLREELKAG